MKSLIGKEWRDAKDGSVIEVDIGKGGKKTIGQKGGAGICTALFLSEALLSSHSRSRCSGCRNHRSRSHRSIPGTERSK